MVSVAFMWPLLLLLIWLCSVDGSVVLGWFSDVVVDVATVDDALGGVTGRGERGGASITLENSVHNDVNFRRFVCFPGVDLFGLICFFLHLDGFGLRI